MLPPALFDLRSAPRAGSGGPRRHELVRAWRATRGGNQPTTLGGGSASFWERALRCVDEADRGPSTPPPPPLSEVVGSSGAAAEPAPALLESGEVSPSPRLPEAAEPAPAPVAVDEVRPGEMGWERGLPQPPQLDGPPPVDRALTCQSVFLVAEQLLSGELGPVGVDVVLYGTTTLSQHPERFAQVVTELSTSTDQVELATFAADGVQVYLMPRGESLFAVDKADCHPLLFLAHLLGCESVRKILMSTRSVYQLLFLMFGTDRIDVRNVVDVAVWSAVLQHVAGYVPLGRAAAAGPAPREISRLGQVSAALGTTKDGEDHAPVTRLLPVDALDAVTHTINHARQRVQLWEMDLRDALRQPSAAGGPCKRQRPLEFVTDVTTATATPASLNGAEDATQLQREQRRAAIHATCAELRRHLDAAERLMVVFACYTHLLLPAESTAATAAAASAGGPPTPTLADLCHQETAVEFLCAAMSHHGVHVSMNHFHLAEYDVQSKCSHLNRRWEGTLSRRVTASAAAASTAAPGSADWDDERECGTSLLTTISASQLLALLLEEYPTLFAAPDTDTAKTAAGLAPRPPASSANWTEAQCEQYLVREVYAVVRDRMPLLRDWLLAEDLRSYLTQRSHLLSRKGHTVIPHIFDAPRSATAHSAPGGAEPVSDAGVPMSTKEVWYSIHPTWTVHRLATGRLFSSAPNLQTLPKGQPLSRVSAPLPHDGGDVAGERDPPKLPLLTSPHHAVRYACRAVPGCVFVSLDFNQIELRVLAHMSGDPNLVQQLTAGGDVLGRMASAIFSTPTPTRAQRDAAKVVVYGFLYGMGIPEMQRRLNAIHQAGWEGHVVNGDHDVQAAPAAPVAHLIIRSFNAVYPGVTSYLKRTRMQAYHEKTCHMLRCTRDLGEEADGNRRKQTAVALAIQGSAADILKSAMVAIHCHRRQMLPYLPLTPCILVATVHDELIYAVPAQAVDLLAPLLQEHMERQSSALGLRVPLTVTVKVGPSLGDVA